MGGNGGSNTKSSTTKNYKTTTTSNPYMVSKTTNKGTTTNFKNGTALQSVYDFSNNNIGDLLNQYLNPTLDSTTNQAKMNEFNKSQQQNLQNNIINPLAQNNMIRSSQATNMYNNLSNQSADYANSLLANSQQDTGNTINNLMNYVLQGWNVANGNQAQSLNTSAGNADTTTTGKTRNLSL